MNYVERNGYLVEVWRVWYVINGFKVFILVKGTEPEMQDYLTSEMGYVGRYSAITEQEESDAIQLGANIYLCPQDPHVTRN